MTMGPLPGVSAPRNDGSAPSCGYTSQLWVLHHWRSLSPEQRLAVEQRISGQTTASSDRHTISSALAAAIPGLGGTEESCSVAQSPPWTESERASVRALVARLLENATPMASFSTCVMGVGKLVVEQPQLARGLLGHEVVHCFQQDAFDGTVEEWGEMNTRDGSSMQYIVEGGPAWIGEELAGGTDFSAGWWYSYINGRRSHGEGRFSLLLYEYDAIGFYAHLSARGAPIWRALVPAVNQGPHEFFDALVGSVRPETEPLSTWASATVRRPWGAAWQAAGRVIPPDARREAHRVDTLRAGVSATISAAPMAQYVAQFPLQSNVRVVRVVGQGHARFVRWQRRALGQRTAALGLVRRKLPVPGRTTDRGRRAKHGDGERWRAVDHRALGFGQRADRARGVRAGSVHDDPCATGRGATGADPTRGADPWAGRLAARRVAARHRSLDRVRYASSPARYSLPRNADVELHRSRSARRARGLLCRVHVAQSGHRRSGDHQDLRARRDHRDVARERRARFVYACCERAVISRADHDGGVALPLPPTTIGADQMPELTPTTARYECIPNRRLTFFLPNSTRAVYRKR